nr:tetratricopeptide repeat protein [uncultured Desulfobulbus sp.]
MKINGSSYSPYSYAIEKLNNGVAYDPEYYKDGKEFKIPRNKLTKLNFLNTIKSAHRLNDNQDTVKYKIALSQCQDRRYDKSKINIDEVIKSTLDPEQYENLADCFYKEKKYNQAATLYIKSAEYSPTKARPSNMAGICYVLIGRYHDAITHYLKAIQANPKYTSTYGNLGSAYSKINDTKNALKYYRIALQEKNPSKTIITNYVEALFIEGENINFGKIPNNDKNLQDKNYRMTIEMFKILQSSQKGVDISKQLSNWKKLYSGTKLDWNFDQLEAWAQTDEQKRIIESFKSISI